MTNKRVVLVCFVGVFILGGVSTVAAQEAPPSAPIDVSSMLNQAQTQGQAAASAGEPVTPPALSYEELVIRYRELQENNKKIYLIILAIFTPIALFLVLFFMNRGKGVTGRNLVNGAGLVLVVCATIFVIVAANTEQQMTASVGILGAIAGYLFGTTTAGTGSSKEESSGPK